jgi:hypothetical protein
LGRLAPDSGGNSRSLKWARIVLRMSATGADRPSEPPWLPADEPTRRVNRATLLAGRSIGPFFYLVSVGLIAAWIIGAFFGIGFVFLMHPSAKLTGFGSDAGNYTVLLPESPWLMQSTSKLDRLYPGPFSESSKSVENGVAAGVGDRDRPAIATTNQSATDIDRKAAPAGPGTAQITGEIEERALSVDLASTRSANELAPMPPSQSQRAGAADSAGKAPSPQTASSRKSSDRRPAKPRSPHPHAPVQAIQDVLQKHSRLAK